MNYREDTSWAIRNDNEAIIGKVLTDGFVATFNSVRVRNVTLCLKLSELRLDYLQASNFPILDVAVR